ncbi:GNAT family N-acetyltransferase [Hydrogenimonas sp.]
MTQESYRLLDVAEHPEYLEAAERIYDASFPAWEKEPISRIRERIASGRYRCVVYVEGERVLGFYLLDIDRELRFTLFSFLAVDRAWRGRGIGTTLCRAAIEDFRHDPESLWLMIEAEDRQAIFYGRLGFRKILLDYRVPRFDDEGSVPMHLMAVEKDVPLDADRLRRIVREIFVRGYGLSPDDPRIREQLERIPERIELIKWPRSEQ